MDRFDSSAKSRSSARLRAYALAALTLLAAWSGARADPEGENRVHWATTWATASKTPVPIFDPPLPAFNDTTLRQVVRITSGGEGLRVWLTNEFGTAPLKIGGARVALRDSGSAIVASSDHPLTFGGAAAVAIPPGARVVSDPVALEVPNLTELAISLYLPEDPAATNSPVSYHVRALQTNYISDGDQTAATDLSAPQTTTAWYFLAAVEVATRREIPVVAALGDSITDGDQLAAPNEPIDLNDRYTDFLAEMLLGEKRGKRKGARVGVINLGISGNQASATLIGDNALARLGRDVLTRSGVTHVIFLEGINDIGLPVLLNLIGLGPLFGDPVAATAEQIIAVHQQVIEQIHAGGLIAVGGTITPAGSSMLPGYFGPTAEATRQRVNTWIRSSSDYDVVVDFDALLRDPADPTIMRADLTADGLHPNSSGYRLMGEAVRDALAPRLKAQTRRRRD